MRNTPKKGLFRHIVFKDGGSWYAVALEFNIVESSDDPRLALFSMYQAVDGYLNSMRKIKGLKDRHALNQKADPEYEKLWSILISKKQNLNRKPIKSPFPVANYGYSALPSM